MKRRGFLYGALAVGAAAPAALQAATYVFHGTLGVYAIHLTAAAPFVQEHGNAVFSSASVIKLLIAVGTMRRLHRRGLSLDTLLRISRDDIVDASDSFGKAKPGSYAPVRALVTAMITQSDNTAANALLDWCGESTLNALAVELGLRATRFERRFMDFAARAAGFDNLTSPRDMAMLAKGIALGVSAGYGGATASGCRFIYDAMLRQEDRETIPTGIARSVTIANKTGELERVRHDVAIVDLGQSDAYAVALLSQNWTSRSSAVQALRAVAADVDRKAMLLTLPAQP